jgi:hypothetical protein
VAVIRIPVVPSHSSPPKTSANLGGLGTSLLLSEPTDYCDRFGSALRKLDESERYCRALSDLSPSIHPEAANERELMLLNIRVARKETRWGPYLRHLLLGIDSSQRWLAQAVSGYTRSGLKAKKNFRAPKIRDSHELRQKFERDQKIVEEVRRLLSERMGLKIGSAAKIVKNALDKSEIYNSLTIRHIRNICRAAGIVPQKSPSKKKKA